MSEAVKITLSHLSARMGIVYLRQSSAAQVEHNCVLDLSRVGLAQIFNCHTGEMAQGYLDCLTHCRPPGPTLQPAFCAISRERSTRAAIWPADRSGPRDLLVLRPAQRAVREMPIPTASSPSCSGTDSTSGLSRVLTQRSVEHISADSAKAFQAGVCVSPTGDAEPASWRPFRSVHAAGIKCGLREAKSPATRERPALSGS